MQIRATQLAEFEAVAEFRFCDTVVDYISAHHGSIAVPLGKGEVQIERIPRPQIRAMVDAALKRGRGHGLASAAILTSFVVLAFLVAPDFDDHPDIRSALHDDLVPPDHCMRDIVESMTDGDWETIRAGSYVNDWINITGGVGGR